MNSQKMPGTFDRYATNSCNSCIRKLIVTGLSSAIIFLLSMAVFYFLNRVFGNKK